MCIIAGHHSEEKYRRHRHPASGSSSPLMDGKMTECTRRFLFKWLTTSNNDEVQTKTDETPYPGILTPIKLHTKRSEKHNSLLLSSPVF